MMKFNTYKALAIVIALITISLFSVGNTFASGDTEEPFDAGSMIMHHVTDAHDIHLMDIGEHHVSIPLPIIMYSVDNGLSVFSSSAFHHGHAAVDAGSSENGNYYYVLHHEQVYRMRPTNDHFDPTHVTEQDIESMIYSDASLIASAKGETGAYFDFSITKTATGIFITVLFMFFVFLSVAKAYKRNPNKAPKGLQAFMEPLILFVTDEVIKPSIGEKHYMRFVPFLLTVFFFIWFANMLGLIPFIGGFNVTGNIAVTIVLALLVFIITTVSANKNYWMHIVATPGVPGWLLPLMIPIEIFGMILKPGVLCLRLFANITAGHIIILAFMSLIFIFANLYGTGAGYGASLLALLFSIFMNLLELLVAFLQAYVFTLLASLYFGAAVEEHH
jgi:F-type H+-transporting ATPase subunit a